MIARSFAYDKGSRWSVDELPELDSPNTLVIVFAAPEYFEDSKPIQELRAAYPNSHMIGCSTSGEIAGESLADLSLSVGVMRFEHTQLRSASASVGTAKDSYLAATSLARKLDAPDLRAIFTLADGLYVNGSEFVSGFNDHLQKGVIVTGGLAGDGSEFRQTFVIHGGELRDHSACAIGFYGDKVVAGHASKGGWDKFGHERVVTRSQGNVLFELDGKPALEIYKLYLGECASALPDSALRFPLSVRESQDDNSPFVRSILAVNEEEGSMTFAGDVPEGALAQFLYSNMDRVIGGAWDAAHEAEASGTGDMVAIGISCVGRRLVLGDRTEEEIEAVKDAMPDQTHVIGFYSYGELSPFANGKCGLHNQSMTITTYREAA